MTTYQLYAMNEDGISIGSCGHRHVRRDRADECTWRPTYEDGRPKAFTRLVVHSVERGPVAGFDRGAVSISATKFELFKAGAESRNMSMSQLVEEACEKDLAAFFGSPTKQTTLSSERRLQYSKMSRGRGGRAA